LSETLIDATIAAFRAGDVTPHADGTVTVEFDRFRLSCP
jgi:hypothetical protein